MIRIGVIGENENDIKAISALLKKNFPEQFHFHRLLPNINGSQLDDTNDNHLVIKLRREFELEDLHYVLYIRDLDAFIDDRKKVGFRKKRFRRFAKTVDGQAIFMLNVYEIEALILADIETFKTYVKKYDIEFDSKNAAITTEPDKVLEKLIAYSKSDLKTIIPLLNIAILQENHIHFKAFLREFIKMLEQKKYNKAPY